MASLAGAVVRPVAPGRQNVGVLGPFVASQEQNHQRFSVVAEIHAIARPLIDARLMHALSHGSNARPETAFEFSNGGIDPRFGPGVRDAGEAIAERTDSADAKVFTGFGHPDC